MLRLKMLRKKK